MTLSDLASLGNFVGGIAVVLSLLYVALQMRQAAKHSRSLIGHERTTRVVDMNYRLTDRDLATLVVKAKKGDEHLDEVEFYRFMAYARATFWHAEDTFFQHRDGLLKDSAFQSFTATHQTLMANPGMRVAWTFLSQSFDRDFAAFMDGLIENRASEFGIYSFDDWAQAAAKERLAMSPVAVNTQHAIRDTKPDVTT